jgi:xanthine dehydrogenase accessory factor
VVDHRSLEFAHPERFPGARVIECPDPRTLSRTATFTPLTAAVVMSHHFARDLDYVRSLMESNVAYIGVLGPRPRFERMMSEMKAAGDATPRTDRVFAPVGLDVGGEGPDAIALAIIAEVSAVMSDRSGQHLRDQATLHSSPNAIKAERA